MAAPAFTSVPARLALGGSQTQTEPSQKKQWPPAVRTYVQRSFQDEHRVAGVSVEEMSAKLKEVISRAADSGQLETIDWGSLKLPQEMIKDERAQSVRGTPSFAIQSPLHTNVSDPVSPTNHSKKRKSSEMANDHDPNNDISQSPWKKANQTRNLFEERVTYASPAQAKKMEKRQRRMQDDPIPQEPSSKFMANLEKRRNRFELGKIGSPSPILSLSRDDTPDANDGPVVGTCQTLEKNYFRLTSAPKPETVRPVEVLKKTLDLLKKKWRNENNYSYICDQFKSLRQDLTVQHIKNGFTVDVYELHARIALEKGDLGEYNQCQTQLRALYKQNLGGHPAEFLAYRILYFIYTCNRTDMNDTLADLTLADRNDQAVKHALDLRSALASGNYHRFFKLFHDTPHMGGYLIDMFIARERLAALANICKAFKPDIKLGFLTEELGFESDQECCSFVCDHGGDSLFDDKKPDGIFFNTGKAGPVFEQAKQQAFRKVDIKGQI